MIDEKIAASNRKASLFGGVSAKSYVGLTLSGAVHHATEKDERIFQLEEQNSRLMNLIENNYHFTRSLQTCKINFFPD